MVDRVLVIIPALNEEATVAGVVASVSDHLDADILVVDDGSRDATAERAVAAGATVLRHPFNLGVGAALRTGFQYARAEGYQIAVQLDADGQHDPADAKRLVDLVADGTADLVVGSRFESDYEIGRIRRIGMKMLSRRVSRQLGTTILDTSSGFRAFSRKALVRFADSYPSAYLSDTVEALLLAGDWGLKVVEIPVRMHARMGGTASSGSIKSAFHLIRINLVLSLHRVRRPL
ncbi:MAG: glycosyltransferase family 2 protein [Acidimicrobiales bacterium]